MDEEALERELTAGGVAEVEPDTMPCPICREEIKKGARKCIKCSSDIVGWRRYLSIGNTNLALLTALVSVVATAYPGLHRALVPARAEVSLSGVSVSDRESIGDGPDKAIMTVVASNAGMAAAFVDIDAVHLVVTDPQTHEIFDSSLNFPRISLVLQPGKPQTLRIDLSKTELLPSAEGRGGKIVAAIAKNGAFAGNGFVACGINAEIRDATGTMTFLPHYDTSGRPRNAPWFFCFDLADYFLARMRHGH